MQQLIKDYLANEKVSACVNKLLLGEKIESNQNRVFFLSSVIILSQEVVKKLDVVEKDELKAKELIYALLLRYSLIHDDYLQLYNFTFNFGFYPIARHILLKNLISEENLSVQHSLSDLYVDNFRDGKNILTLHQKKTREELFKDNTSNHQAYIAPTSFGKSEIIIKKIIDSKVKKIAIILPTKSLLKQTFKQIRTSDLITREEYRIILHDEMYDSEDKFIAIFTQERTQSFLQKYTDVSFDMIIIDEAHNLLKGEGRAKILDNIRHWNKNRNPQTKHLYLSPVIKKAEQLLKKPNVNEKISAQHIKQNLKELDIYYYNEEDKSAKKYNRYLNNGDFNDQKSSKKASSVAGIHFLNIGKDCQGLDHTDYIKKMAKEQNFIYINGPSNIQKFVAMFIKNLETTDALNDVIEVIKKHTHSDYLLVKSLEKGVVYLHGKMMDDIKEFLIEQVKNNKEIKYIIANSVILEGMNLPIEAMFILDSQLGDRTISKNSLLNLIGRVNRLNNIFGDDGSLSRLLVPIHFVRCKINKDSKICSIGEDTGKNFIRYLSSLLLEDEEVENNLLRDPAKASAERKKEIEKDLEEQAIITNNIYPLDDVKRNLLLCQLYSIYLYPNHQIDDITEKIRLCKVNKIAPYTKQDDVLEQVFNWIGEMFFPNQNYDENFYNTKAKEMSNIIRLRHSLTREWYMNFIKEQNKPLKERIASTLSYWYKLLDDNALDEEKYFFYLYTFGNKVSPLSKSSLAYFIDIRDYKDKRNKLADFAIIKLKLDDDFVSFHLSKFYTFFLYQGLLDDNEYNLLVYGSVISGKYKELMKKGLSLYHIETLKDGEQLENINVKSLTSLKGNDAYKKWLEDKDIFIQFQFNQFIDI